MRSIICILIATAACAFTCLNTSAAAAAVDTKPQNLAVPFNDLLPPLLEATTDTISTTPKAPTATKTLKTTTPKPISIAKPKTTTTKIVQFTTHSPPPLFKSTKKSYYQQQTEHIKELHLIDDDGVVPHDYSVQAEHLQHLHDQQDKEYRQQKQQQLIQQKLQKPQKQQNVQKTATPVKVASRISSQHVASQPKKAAASNVLKANAKLQSTKHAETQSAGGESARLQIAAGHQKQVNAQKPQQYQQLQRSEQHHQTQHYQQLQQSHQPQQSQQLQQFHQPQQSQQLQQSHQPQQSQQLQSFHQSQQPQPLQQQYRQPHRFQAPVQPFDVDTFQQYFDFQHSTHRPPKAGLPTLTPFPRHLK